MRIAIILGRTPVFGAPITPAHATVALNLARFSTYKDSIRLFPTQTDNEACRQSEFHVTPLPPGLNRAQENRLLHYDLQKWGPDIIEIHSHSSHQVSAIGRALPDAKIVYYLHYCPFSANHSFLTNMRMLWRMRPVDHFICVSQFVAGTLADIYPSFAGKTSAIPNSISAQGFYEACGPRDKLILFSARFVPEKGVEEMMGAIEKILPAFPDWRCAFALPFHYPDHLLDRPVPGQRQSYRDWMNDILARGEALGEQCIMHPGGLPKEELNSLRKNAALFVAPYNWNEGFGLAVLEAHLAGAAVISSGRGGLREVSGDHAHYLPDVSPGSIADALEHFITNEEERLSLVRRGQEYVLKTHNPQKRADELDTLRRSIVSQ